MQPKPHVASLGEAVELLKLLLHPLAACALNAASVAVLTTPLFDKV
jgi:hypothetical protein